MTEMRTVVHAYIAARQRLGDLRESTIRNFRSVLGAFATTYGDRAVGKLRRMDIERWLATRATLKASTRRTQFTTVRTFCRWLLDQGRIARDPMAGMRPPRQPRRMPRAMPYDDVGKLLRACPDSRARAIIALQVGLGLRCIEVARLKVEDWDRREGVIRISGKGDHERMLPVTDMVRRHLLMYLTEHPATSGPMIRSLQGDWAPLKAGTISKLVSDWMRDAGVKITAYDGVSAHALRHTCASDVIDGCHDIVAVQAILGHKDIQTTAIYLRHANLARLREVMEGRTYQQEIPCTG